jgi:hypothetical protein
MPDEWSLGGPLPNLCPMIPTSNQDGHQAKNRKKGGWNLTNIFSSETTEPIIKILFLLSKWFQTRRFLWEFPIGSYVKLSSAVVAILVGVLKCRTQFWKRTTRHSFYIGPIGFFYYQVNDTGSWEPLVNIYYRIFYELWTFADFDRLCKFLFLFLAWWPSLLEVGITRHIFGREPSNDYFIKMLFLLSKWFQTRRFLWEFPIGSYVKLSS